MEADTHSDSSSDIGSDLDLDENYIPKLRTATMNLDDVGFDDNDQFLNDEFDDDLDDNGPPAAAAVASRDIDMDVDMADEDMYDMIDSGDNVRAHYVDDYDDEDMDEDAYSVDDGDEEDETYLQKFKHIVQEDYIAQYHPECKAVNYQEVDSMLEVVRNKDNIIVDPLHQTDPFLTKYEKTRLLGSRTMQLDNGARPFVDVPDNIIESHLIAEMELEQKKLPFIIKRPLPNGGFEYWRVADLEVIRGTY